MSAKGNQKLLRQRMSKQGNQAKPKKMPGFNRYKRSYYHNEPMLVHAYDPARDVACETLGVPYGEVFVDGMPDAIRSHEMRLDGSGNPMCYLHGSMANKWCSAGPRG